MVKSQVLSVTIEAAPEYPLAPEYERVHFVGTALFNIGITKELLDAKADEALSKLEEKIGYRVFLVDIRVTPHGLWTDVDFVMDVPYGYEGSPAITLVAAIAFIAANWQGIILAIIALAFIIWVFWTTWIEKSKIYYCDQCPTFPSFEGYDLYLAHLAAFHPVKYEAASVEPWWEKLAGWGKYIPWIVGGIVGITLLNVIASAASRKRD